MKKRAKKPTPFDVLRNDLKKELGNDEKLHIFPYDLSFENKRAFGVCALSDGKLFFREEGKDETRVIELSSLGEIRFVQNWGCVSLESSDENGDLELCRAEMSLSQIFRIAARKLEAARKGEEIPEPKQNKCKKCGRPFKRGMTTCIDCTDKKKLFSRLLPYVKPHWKTLIGAAIFLVTISLINVVLPMINKIVINDYIANPNVPEDKSGFIWLVILMAFLGLTSAVATMSRGLCIAKSGKGMLVKLREDVYGKLQSLSLTGLNRRSAGELMHRVSEDTNEIRDFVIWLVPSLLQQGLTLFTVACILFAFNWKLTILVIIPIPLLAVLFRVLHRFTHRLYRRQWQMETDAGTLMHDVFSGMRVVKTYGTEKHEEARFDRAAKRIADISKKNERTWNLIMPFASFLLSFGEYAVLFFLGCELVGDPSFIVSGNAGFALGDLMQFTTYVGLMYEPIRWMSNVPRRIARATTSLAKITELIDEKNEMQSLGDERTEIDGNLSFTNASFGYEDAEPVLKNINLDIKNGEMVGLVGRSGVGKTTLANLILRLYDLTDGSFTVDGKDVRAIEQNAYRSQIGVVLQDTFLFNGTIYSNIAYGKPNAEREEVVRAAKLANAHEFIMKQPDGYNTYVGDKGSTLSGGERQRIAIARAILRNPKILILDEATSSLDTETEKQIQEAIARFSGGRTTVAIAHRLSTLRNSDKIVVFEKGRIEEIGSHDELMKNKNRYYRLVMAQKKVNKLNK